MKKLTPILILSLLFLSIGFSQQEYNTNDLIEMDNGLWTEKFSDEPITGKVFGYFGEVSNPKKVYLGNIRNGKREGKWVNYYPSTGKMKSKKTYKDGEKISSNEWTEDGKRNGIHTKWFENGQKEWEGTWNEDGEKDGLLTIWYENGQMRSEGTMKDGKLDGLVTSWYENGQMSGEGTYKDGKVISKKEWNEDGSVKE